MQRWGHKTQLIIPLRIRDRVIALVELFDDREGRDFSRRGGRAGAHHLPVRRAGHRQGAAVRPAARHGRAPRPAGAPPAAPAVVRGRAQPAARPRRPAGGARRGHAAPPSTCCTCAPAAVVGGQRRVHRRALAGGGRRRAAERPRGRRGRPARALRAGHGAAGRRGLRRRRHASPVQAGAGRRPAVRAARERGGASRRPRWWSPTSSRASSTTRTACCSPRSAAQLSASLHNAIAYQREHVIAETFQQALLMEPPAIPGIEVGVRYRAATDSARVGGDFYDLVTLGPGKLMVIVGDVCGKSLAAAAQSAVVRYMLRAYAAEGSPGEALSRLNSAVITQTPNQPFVTLVVAYVDVARHMFEYAVAGPSAADRARRARRVPHARRGQRAGRHLPRRDVPDQPRRAARRLVRRALHGRHHRRAPRRRAVRRGAAARGGARQPAAGRPGARRHAAGDGQGVRRRRARRRLRGGRRSSCRRRRHAAVRGGGARAACGRRSRTARTRPRR